MGSDSLVLPKSNAASKGDVASVLESFADGENTPGIPNRKNKPIGAPQCVTATDGVTFLQSVFVMQHGERVDDVDETWARTTFRPWDPPMTEKGKSQASTAGKRLRNEGWNISRVLVSPFLSCVQTAVEVVTALCLIDGTGGNVHKSKEASKIDPSRVKVSFEYGLCEPMNERAIRNAPAKPSQRYTPWHLPLTELAEMFPAGTFDNTVSTIWTNVPTWRESTANANQRYTSTVLSAANMFLSDNILCITHRQAMGNSTLGHCTRAHVQRPIYNYAFHRCLAAGDWEVLTDRARPVLSSRSTNK